MIVKINYEQKLAPVVTKIFLDNITAEIKMTSQEAKDLFTEKIFDVTPSELDEPGVPISVSFTLQDETLLKTLVRKIKKVVNKPIGAVASNSGRLIIHVHYES